MACSKYEYVKKFEEVRSIIPQTYILVRIDGRGFTKFCSAHEFEKPNDIRAIKLMNLAAEYVCQNFTQIFLAYGQSDEYSFILNKNTTLFSRRVDKILSCVVSAFTSAYVFHWGKFFNTQMKQIPSFDSRIVTYPNEECVKDYFRWRQVDCHINNLYNTIFWCMVKKGMVNTQVQKFLKDTNSAKKNQILFQEFNINYNNIDQIYRRGTFLLYEQINVEQNQMKKQQSSQIQSSKEEPIPKKTEKKQKIRRKLVQSHGDCIKQEFWINLFK